MNVEILVDRFRQHFGHTNMTDEVFLQNEYVYKAKRGRQMLEWLAPQVLKQLVADRNWAEVCRLVVKSFSGRGSLARWDEYEWGNKLDPAEQERFALAFQEFLYGEEPFLDRFDRFVAEATAVYAAARDRDPVFKKRYGGAKLAWPFVSYFHFMMWPDREYAFVKPTFLTTACRLAGFDIQYQSSPNAVTYARVQEFYRALWPTVQSLGGRDWIDVQTLIHVAGGGFGEPQESSAVPVQEETIPAWRAKLRDWLQHNPRTMPAELELLRQEFLQRFPKDRLGDLTLEQYALGHEDYKDSFCYWLERKTEDLGSIRGGSSAKFGVWWDKAAGQWRWNQVYASADDALSHIKAGLLQLVEAVEDRRLDQLDEIGAQGLGLYRYSLRSKPLYLYFPDQFLPISNPNHLAGFLRCLEQDPQGDLHALNRQLLGFLRGLPEFAGVDTRQMGASLYDSFPEVKTGTGSQEGPEPSEPQPPALQRILAHVAASRYTFSPEIVANYHLSLLTKPFVILTGLSGTGKTKLTRLYADAVHQIKEEETNPYYAIIAVRPDWTDNRGLLGYYNPLTCTYEAPSFLRFLLRAAVDPAHWHYACLDEMNLARVEYYFSDFLSALESGEAVSLHPFQGDWVASETGEGIAPRIPEGDAGEEGYQVGGVLYIPSAIRIPPNLLLSGTVNVDETTHAFSDKVLDRANSIEFNHADLDEFADRYRELYPERSALLGEVMPLVQKIYNLLEPCYLHFGYRTVEEVLAYLWHNENLPEAVRQPRALALDNQIMQKILPKLRGDERIHETLEQLRDLLQAELDGSRSVAKLRWMLQELDAFGSTHFWR